MMKRLFFFTVIDFTNWNSDGICKKILTQVKAFRDMGYTVDFCYTKKGDTYIENGNSSQCIGKKRSHIVRKDVCSNVFAYVEDKKYDAVYIRYCFAERSFIKLLKCFHEKCGKVVVEIPTYPYDDEFLDRWDRRLFLALDKVYRNKMYKYVDKIATFSRDDEIFGIPTIQIANGIDFSKIKERKPSELGNTINIIAVAMISKWHGYDRLIRGMGEYYKNGGRREICFYIVGDGDELENYKKIVGEYGIGERVVFCGAMYGEELDALYNKSTLAVEVLGGHRKGIYISSSLKSREYAAKGLPMVTSMIIDIFENTGYSYLYKVSEDENPVDVSQMLEFYDNIYGGKSPETVASEIRNYARGICDIKIVMQPIFEFFKYKL